MYSFTPVCGRCGTSHTGTSICPTSGTGTHMQWQVTTYPNNQGWVCPKCQTCYSPSIDKCTCSIKQGGLGDQTIATNQAGSFGLGSK